MIGIFCSSNLFHFIVYMHIRWLRWSNDYSCIRRHRHRHRHVYAASGSHRGHHHQCITGHESARTRCLACSSIIRLPLNFSKAQNLRLKICFALVNIGYCLQILKWNKTMHETQQINQFILFEFFWKLNCYAKTFKSVFTFWMIH